MHVLDSMSRDDLIRSAATETKKTIACNKLPSPVALVKDEEDKVPKNKGDDSTKDRKQEREQIDEEIRNDDNIQGIPNGPQLIEIIQKDSTNEDCNTAKQNVDNIANDTKLDETLLPVKLSSNEKRCLLSEDSDKLDTSISSEQIEAGKVMPVNLNSNAASELNVIMVKEMLDTCPNVDKSGTVNNQENEMTVESSESNKFGACKTDTSAGSNRKRIYTENCNKPEANIVGVTEEREKTSQTKRTKTVECPTKQLNRELEKNFERHDQILSEFIDQTLNNTTNDTQKHVEQLAEEIQTLDDMIKRKEMEWNNMIHLKKIKEEVMLRITRKRVIQEIESVKLGDNDLQTESATNDTALEEKRSSALTNKLIQITQMSSGLTNTMSTTTQSILQNRANMTSEDLEKQKNNTATLHK